MASTAPSPAGARLGERFAVQLSREQELREKACCMCVGCGQALALRTAAGPSARTNAAVCVVQRVAFARGFTMLHALRDVLARRLTRAGHPMAVGRGQRLA